MIEINSSFFRLVKRRELSVILPFLFYFDFNPSGFFSVAGERCVTDWHGGLCSRVPVDSLFVRILDQDAVWDSGFFFSGWVVSNETLPWAGN